MEFLKLEDLKLNPAGYLVNKKTDKPVNHTEFVKQQKAAEYIVKLSEAIKDKNFTCGKLDNLDEIKASVLAEINKKNIKEYIEVPKAPTSKVNDEMVQFALDFVKHGETKRQVEKLNKIMNEFDIIDAIESVGDYFTEGLVKLNKLYTTKDILKAVKINAEKLK